MVNKHTLHKIRIGKVNDFLVSLHKLWDIKLIGIETNVGEYSSIGGIKEFMFIFKC